MKRSGLSLILLTGMVILLTGSYVLADVKLNPYDPIVERNPFGLKPPPPPEDPSSKIPPAPPAPPATVELTGITTILSSKKALLEIIPGPGKPMIRRIAVEGERFDSIEVVSIDVDKNEVVVKNGSVITNLTFRVAKSSPGPATLGNPGAVPLPRLGGVVPPPAAQTTQNFNQGNTRGGGRRGVMVSGGNNAEPLGGGYTGNSGLGNLIPSQAGVNNNYAPGGVAAHLGGGEQLGSAHVNNNYSPGGVAAPTLGGGVQNSGFRSIPSRNIRSDTVPRLSPEEQVLEIERNEILNKRSGRIVPPLPPTLLNPIRTPILPPLPGQQ